MKLQEKLADNKKKGKALLATNFYNFETLSAVLTAAKKTNSEIILQLSESSIKYMGLKVAKALAEGAIDQYGVTAWLHLDHGQDTTLVKKCIDAGFDSVMIDASEKSFNENVKITQEIVKYAQNYKINVEAELGYISKLGQDQKMIYTQPKEAKRFVEATGVNALAIAVGSAHGFYKEVPKLQIDLIGEINAVTDASLVLHGSSGIPDDQLQAAIKKGITKINLATEIKNIFMKSLQKELKETENIDLREVFPKATQEATSLVMHKLKIINFKPIFVKTIALLFALFSTITNFSQNEILLKDYNPKSIYNIPKTVIERAKFPVIDMHSHPDATSKEEIEQWLSTMNKVGIEKTIILSYETGKAFDSIYSIYSKYNGRFEVWCGFDFTGYNEKGWSEKAVKELERCFKVGAKGVGELGDKGEGFFYSKPAKAFGMHIDDERMKPLIKKCGALGMPISIHVADPYWMYQPINTTNDGLMNALYWKIDTSKKDILSHAELITTLKNAVEKNPKTTFIACHLANCTYDLKIIGNLLDTNDNLFVEIAARYAETATVPRYTKAFYEKYQDKLLYGTDMGFEPSMYKITFRILETEDEHFYEKKLFSYQWALNGLGLNDTVLKKLYYENAKKITN